jgi:hypothetical protein
VTDWILEICCAEGIRMSPMILPVFYALLTPLRTGYIFSLIVTSAKGYGIICKWIGHRKIQLGCSLVLGNTSLRFAFAVLHGKLVFVIQPESSSE